MVELEEDLLRERKILAWDELASPNLCEVKVRLGSSGIAKRFCVEVNTSPLMTILSSKTVAVVTLNIYGWKKPSQIPSIFPTAPVEL